MAADTLDDVSQLIKTRRLVYLMVAYPIVMIACAFALVRFGLGWPGVAVLLVVGMGGMFALIRAGQARARLLGCGSPAMTRYSRRMMIASLCYMAILFLAVYLFGELHVRGPLLWALALATALPVLGMIWAMGRLVIEESDEYLRSRIVHQALFGTGGLLALATVWGFLEQFMLVPHVPAWAAVPTFAVMLGVSQLFPKVRA
jgi:hypothetical protein